MTNHLYEHAEEPMPPKPNYDPAMDAPEPEMLIDDSEALIAATAEVMNIKPCDITGRRKTHAIAFARQIVMYLWAEAHSLQASCEIVGRKNHTASHYARRKIYERLHYCKHTKTRLQKVLQKYSQIILAKNQNQNKIASASTDAQSN